MDIINRARNIITRPGTEWAVIDAEPASAGGLYASYLVPLAVIGPIATFIGLSVIGMSVPFIGTYRTPLIGGLTSAIIGFAGILIGVYLWALIIDALAPTFSGQKNLLAALKVTIFAATPGLLAGICGLLPTLGILQLIAALYGFYLLYLGLPVLMKVPREKALGYTALTVVCGFVIGIVFSALIAALHFALPGYGFGQRAFAPVPRDVVAQSAIAGAIGAAAGAAAGGNSQDTAKAAATIAAGVMAASKAAEGANAANPATAANPNAAAPAAAAAAVVALVGGGKPHVAAVDFHALEAFLPSGVGPLSRRDAHGETSTTAGFEASNAEGVYGDSSGDGINVTIRDLGNASGMLALGSILFSTESQSDSGYEKNVTLNGNEVHEKWTTAGKISDLTTFVGNRFVVEVKGNGVDIPVAEGAITSMKLDSLAALKG